MKAKKALHNSKAVIASVAKQSMLACQSITGGSPRRCAPRDDAILRTFPKTGAGILLLLLLVVPAYSWAQGIPMINVTGTGKDTQYSLSLQLLALMTVLTLLPSLLLMMTSFVRIIIVMSILRQALGTGQTPPNNVLVGIALFLTLFIMAPTLEAVYQNAALPYMEQGMKFDKIT